MMFDLLFDAMSKWEWWLIAGIVLLMLEVFVSGTVLLWPGIAALIVGIVALLLGSSWQINLVIFSILSVLLAFTVRGRYLEARMATDKPDLNKRGNQLVGRNCQLETECTATSGRANLGDTSWSCRTVEGIANIPAGTVVKVVAVEGTILLVVPHQVEHD